jgi:hypothetical protein
VLVLVPVLVLGGAMAPLELQGIGDCNGYRARDGYIVMDDRDVCVQRKAARVAERSGWANVARTGVKRKHVAVVLCSMACPARLSRLGERVAK